jgi:mannose/cellobiose epimerase-like protein (N-acyl-D-glucosamine 2-epimerase family)
MNTAKKIETVPAGSPRIATLVTQTIIPAWASAFDGSGCRLVDPVGSLRDPRAAPVATLRTQAQRIDAVAECALAGLGGANAPRAAHLLALGLQQFLGADGEPGFPRAVDSEGAVVDSARDFESHAWLLRSVAKVYALTGAPETLLVADLILDFLDSHLAHAVAGYRPDGSGGRLGGQRGHLRLLEGILILHRHGGRRQDFDRACALTELFRYHLLDRAAGMVPEYFDRDWRAVESDEDAVFKPRTAAQWIVALTQFRAQGGDPGLAAEIAILRRGLSNCVDARGFVPETVQPGGRATSEGAELATQLSFFAATQAIDGFGEKARERLGDLDRAIAATFLEQAVTGCWIESVDAKNWSRGAPVRLSTLTALVHHCAQTASAADADDARLLSFAAGAKRASYAA